MLRYALEDAALYRRRADWSPWFFLGSDSFATRRRRSDPAGSV